MSIRKFEELVAWIQPELMVFPAGFLFLKVGMRIRLGPSSKEARIHSGFTVSI